MAADSKDVELRIRARDYSQKTLGELIDTLKELVDAQARQQEAAKRGESSAKELEASYRKLENAAKALISQHSLTKTFEAQSRALDEAKARTDAARQAQQEYQQSLAGVEQLTKKQEAAQTKLAKAVTGAERAQQRAEDRVAATAAKLRDYGIAADGIASSQTAIATAIQTANAALERQDQALATVEDDLRKARAAAEAKAQADREAAKAVEDALRAAEQQAAADRKAADAAEAEAKAQEELRAALNKAADDAVGLAKGYETLASSIVTLGATPLAQTIREINDPAGEAIKNLKGIEDAVGGLEQRIAAIDGPVKDYRQTLTELQAVQKSLANVAGMIDAYRRQEEAVERARVEYEAAQAAVRGLTEQMRSGNGTVAELGRQMSAAQARLRAAATEMRNQSQAAQNLKETLHAADISTRNLAESEERVINAAKRAKASTDQLTIAYQKHGAAVKQSDDAMLKWFNNGRTTLSWMQRMRGELLSLATAYIGVQAAINLASDALEAYRSTQAIESRLSLVVGSDAAAIRQEWDYLLGQANRLGFGFEQLALDYSKFGVSARAAGLTLEETRFIFERMAESARGARLSTDDFGGVMRALEQMLAKGSIQAEELRQQLGDRLPGAFALAAKGAGMSMAEFTKALELGEISSEYVINLAREAGDTYADAFDIAADSMAAAEGRLQTSMFLFRKAIADNGFTDAYTQFITELTDLLNSDEGAHLAELLSDGFTAVVEVLRWCAENVDTLKLAFAAFAAFNVAALFASMAPGIKAVSTGITDIFKSVTKLKGGMKALPAMIGSFGAAAGTGAAGATAMATAVKLLGLAVRTALRFVPLLGAAITAWEVYDLLTSKEDDAEKAGKKIGEAAAKGVEEGLRTGDPGTGGKEGDIIRRGILRTLDVEDQRTAKMDVNTRKKVAKDDLDERLRIASELYEGLKKQAEASIKDEQDRADTIARINESLNKRLAAERAKYAEEQARGDDRAAERRKRIAEEVAMELGRIEDDLAKRDAMQDPTRSFDERMKARVEAIAHEYDKLSRKIQQMSRFDAAGAAAAKAKVDEYVKYRQELEAAKVRQEELSRLEKQLNDQVSLRSALLSSLQAQYDTGNISQEEYRAKVAQTNIELGEGVARAGQAVREFAESMRDMMDPAAFATMMARVDQTLATHNAAILNQQTELAAAEADANLVIAERDRLLEGIRTQYDLGLISESEMVRRVNETNDQYRERIALLAQAAIDAARATATNTPEQAAQQAATIAYWDQILLKTQHARQELTELDRVMIGSFFNNTVTAFDTMAQSIANVITGQQGMRDMFADLGVASAQFFAQFLRDVGQALIKMALLKMMEQSGNPYLVAAAGVMQRHNGGVIGSGGAHTRRVDPSWFAGAPRFHNGGLPGLQPNEVPAILEKGEEVLDRDNPRHILNGGGAGGGGSNRFVLVDDRSKVAEAMNSAEGEEVTMIHLRRNIPTLKQMLK